MQRLITITRHLKEAQFNSIAISANVIVTQSLSAQFLFVIVVVVVVRTLSRRNSPDSDYKVY
jgi:hypothetical protein